MNPKRKDDLANRIRVAQERRMNFGLTVNQMRTQTPIIVKDVPYKQKIVRSRSTRPKQIEFDNKNTIFLSGGIGDTFAVESFLSDSTKKRMTSILYGTLKNKMLMELFQSANTYSHITNHKVIWDDFSQFWCFYSYDECLKATGESDRSSTRIVLDLSILPIFRKVESGLLHYNKSSFLIDQLANIDKIDLPSQFIVVCPFSNDKRMTGRDFNQRDWDNCLRSLQATNIFGVVLNQGNEAIPESAKLINLTNKTTICEAVEILKKASGYIGIDSALSVLAAKQFKASQLMIKSINDHCYRNAKHYYAPQTNFNFMNANIKSISLIV